MALSPLILIIGTIMSYFIVKVINIILSKRTCYKSICDLDIYMEDEKIQVKALLDTGNKLTDPFSGLPVVVWEYSDASKIIPPDLDKFFCEPSKYTEDLNASEWKKKVRLIPCDTVAGKTILPAFKPQKIIIDKKGINKDISAYLAITTNRISDGEYHAIIGNIN